MEHGEGKKAILECPAGFSIFTDGGFSPVHEETLVRLYPEEIEVLIPGGRILGYRYREILQIDPGEYQLLLTPASGDKFRLSHLGYLYEDFTTTLFHLRSEMLIKDMLMQETIHKKGLGGEYVFMENSGRELQRGPCESRLYKTALVIIPEQNDPIRIPFSEISKIEEVEHQLLITTEEGHKFIFSMMGYQLDPFKKALYEAMAEVERDTRTLITSLVPGIDSHEINRCAHLFREGKAARRSEVETCAPGLWDELEKSLAVSPIAKEYACLKSLSRQDKICIGVKKGLMGDLDREYIWCLFPIYSLDPAQPGNALAMESFSGLENGVSRATYFFRIVGRDIYPTFTDLQELHLETDRFITLINRCLIAINFRREPIYLPEEKLTEPRYIKYRYALHRMPALQMLREHFIGRVNHVSFEQWGQDVHDLLQFNTGARDNRSQWSKGNDRQS